jgi:hypothetical protein
MLQIIDFIFIFAFEKSKIYIFEASRVQNMAGLLFGRDYIPTHSS